MPSEAVYKFFKQMMIPGFKKLLIETRYQLIIAIHRDWQGTLKKLASALDVSRNTIKSALCWGEHPYPLGAPGHPCKLGDVHKEFIRMRTEANRRLSNAALANELAAAFPELGSVCENVVGKARKKMHMFYLPMRGVCHMSPANRAFRVEWCRNHQNNNTNWRNIVFTDESWFELGEHKHYVWRTHQDYGPDVCYSKQAHPKKVMVWGAIGYNFKSSLHFINGTVTGEYYYDNIIMGGFLDEADAAFGHMDWVLQQDNARPHIKKNIVEAMEYTGITIAKPWPPYSPDPNVIERIWAIMKLRAQQYRPGTIPELIVVVQEVWNELSMNTINGLVDEMPRRLCQIIHNDGHTITKLAYDN
jgi:hypothetical protein